MTLIVQDSRLRLKQSNYPGVVPTVPGPSASALNHTDGNWLATDLYPGEFYVNVVDEKVWFMGSTVHQIYPALGASSSQDVFLYSGLTAFPGTGSVDKIYIAKDTQTSYFWNSGPGIYEVIGTTASVLWSSISGGPSSTPAQIDLTVAAKHGVNDVNSSHYTKLESDGPTGASGAKVDKKLGYDLSKNDFSDYYKGILDSDIHQILFCTSEADRPIPGSDNILYVCYLEETISIWQTSLGAYSNIGGGGGVDRLEDLLDVSLTGLTGGQVLQYNASASKWENVNADIESGTPYYLPMYDSLGTGLTDSGFSTFLTTSNWYGLKTSPVTGRFLSINDYTDIVSTDLRGLSIDLASNKPSGWAQSIGLAISTAVQHSSQATFGFTSTVTNSSSGDFNMIAGGSISAHSESANDSVLGLQIQVSGACPNKVALALIDGTEGEGKVLTSDSSGNASWKTTSVTKLSRPIESSGFSMVTRTNSVDTWDEIDYKALNVSTHLASTSGKIMMNWKADGTGFEYTIFGAHDYGDCTPFNIYPSYVGPWMYELLVTITSNAWTTYTSITNK